MRTSSFAAIVVLLVAVGCGSNHCTDGAACVPANPCHLGTQDCGTNACQDIDQLQPNGTACGSGICVAGTCIDGGSNVCAATATCGPSAASTCLETDPNNCGACGTVCQTGSCVRGECFGCRPNFPQDCRGDEFCVNGFCASRCAFDLDAGAERTCGIEGLCRPFETTDPPRYNVGLCTPVGDPSAPGLGDPCDGGCQGALECRPGIIKSTGASACTSICDPFLPTSCPTNWGCEALADPVGLYLGFGYCEPITSGELDVGEACGGPEHCRPGTACAGGGLTDGGNACALVCDPMAADGGCGPDGCAFFSTETDSYSGIGACAAVSFGTQKLNDSCTFEYCALPFTCEALAAGGADCLQVCDPWQPNCPAGSGCIPSFGIQSNDYLQEGVCYPVVQNPQPEFGQCSATVNNCDANLYCLPQSGDNGTCVLFCDPFDPSTCPSQQLCNALSDPQGTYAGAGLCFEINGNAHDGASCVYGDCLSGDCYFRSPKDPSGICIHACPLGSQTACLGGRCVDQGFGGGLGSCARLDGGAWE